MIGFGTWVDLVGGETPDQMIQATKTAFEVGYRHFDLAFSYQTETEVLSVLEKSPRNSYLLTNKAHTIPSMLKGSTYYDLFLLHAPPLMTGQLFNDRLLEEWVKLNRLLKLGQVKKIGVSNFYQNQLTILLDLCEKNKLVPPSYNQVEIHLFNQEWELSEFCLQKKIQMIAHTPLGGLGSKEILKMPEVIAISKEINSTPAQALLAATMRRGIVVIPKSRNPEHIRENFNSINYIKSITEDHLAKLRQLDVKFPIIELSAKCKQLDDLLSVAKSS